MVSEGVDIYTWWTPTSNLVTVLTQFLAVCRLVSFTGDPSRTRTSTTEGDRTERIRMEGMQNLVRIYHASFGLLTRCYVFPDTDQYGGERGGYIYYVLIAVSGCGGCRGDEDDANTHRRYWD